MTVAFLALVLSTALLSLFTLGLLQRNLGESVARQRVAWQPDGRFFNVQYLVYLTTFAATLVGIALHSVADRPALLLWSGTWLLTVLWTFVFDSQRNLKLAALIMIGAFGTSLAALFLQQAWQSQTGEQVLLFAPLSLLSGLLFFASSVSVGSALSCAEDDFGEIAAKDEISLRIWEDATRDAIFARRKHTTTTQNVTMVILALVGGCLALAIPDPIFVWPIVWAVILQRGFPRSIWMWIALAILVAACVVSVVRVFSWEF